MPTDATDATDGVDAATAPGTAVLIDRPGSMDRDDAIAVRRIVGGWDVDVHIAAVAPLVPVDSPADLDARERVRSRYLPNRTLRMLPGAIERRATLLDGSDGRPTLRFALRFDAAAALVSVELGLDELPEATALSYEAASATITDPAHPQHRTLASAHELARALLARRQATGALAVYDVTHGWATDEEGNVVRLGAAERNAGYVIVQELMIATNAAAAHWAADRELPILFRNHRMSAVTPPREVWLEDLAAAQAAAGVIGDGSDNDGGNDDPGGDGSGNAPLLALRHRLELVQRPAVYEPWVAGHFGLNLPVYTHATSPLRRYPDLVNQRILLAAAAGSPSPHPAEPLAELGAEINQRLLEFRAERAEHYRQAANAETRKRLSAGGYRALDSAALHKVLQSVGEQPAPPSALTEEVERRIARGGLPERDMCQVLLLANRPLAPGAAHGQPSGPDGWRALRAAVLRHLTEHPAMAITVLTMYPTLAQLDPVQWETPVEVVNGPVSDRPVFGVIARLGAVRSQIRHAHAKKLARQQAALGLLAALAGLPDPSDDVTDIDTGADIDIDINIDMEPDGTGGAETTSDDRLPPIPPDQPPLMTLNQLVQVGILADPRWMFEHAGPMHEPEHTGILSVLDLRVQRERTARGTGRTRAEAKRAAAETLIGHLMST